MCGFSVLGHSVLVYAMSSEKLSDSDSLLMLALTNPSKAVKQYSSIREFYAAKNIWPLYSEPVSEVNGDKSYVLKNSNPPLTQFNNKRNGGDINCFTVTTEYSRAMNGSEVSATENMDPLSTDHQDTIYDDGVDYYTRENVDPLSGVEVIDIDDDVSDSRSVEIKDEIDMLDVDIIDMEKCVPISPSTFPPAITDNSRTSCQGSEEGVTAVRPPDTTELPAIAEATGMSGYLKYPPDLLSEPPADRNSSPEDETERRLTRRTSISTPTTAKKTSKPPQPPRTTPNMQVETECLLDTVKEFYDIVAMKSYNSSILMNKNKVWEVIRARYNLATGQERTSKQLRKKWSNIRSKALQYYSDKDNSRNVRTRASTGSESISSEATVQMNSISEPQQNSQDSNGDLHRQLICDESGSSDRSTTFYMANPEPLSLPDSEECIMDPLVESVSVPNPSSVEPDYCLGPGAPTVFHTIPSSRPEHCRGQAAQPEFHSESLQAIQCHSDPLSEPECNIGLSRERLSYTSPSFEPVCSVAVSGETYHGKRLNQPIMTNHSPEEKRTGSEKTNNMKVLKENVLITALRTATENNRRKMEMDKAFHARRMSYLEEYHRQQMKVLELEKLYWKKKILNEGL